MSTTENQWLSTKAAAERLGVTPRTLYRLIDAGELPAYKFGRVIRLRALEVEAFIDASRIAPGALKHLYPDSADGVREAGENEVQSDGPAASTAAD